MCCCPPLAELTLPPLPSLYADLRGERSRFTCTSVLTLHGHVDWHERHASSHLLIMNRVAYLLTMTGAQVRRVDKSTRSRTGKSVVNRGVFCKAHGATYSIVGVMWRCCDVSTSPLSSGPVASARSSRELLRDPA